ncbi:MAG TPA: tetratricopeptide repeat protein [Bryobacteraceae bacterium]|nr:tetratricopeptide repeat protein [Bryobacteraceae bacterium]
MPAPTSSDVTAHSPVRSQAHVWFAAGCKETSLKEFADAAVSFRRALEIDPSWPEAKHNLGRALFELGQIHEAMALFREVADSNVPELSRRAIAVTIPGSPSDGNAAILDARRAWAETYLPQARPPGRFADRRRATGEPLRVGYLSSFFQHEKWMKPVWSLINQHDRRSIEVHLFCDAPRSRITREYRARENDGFHDISGLSNQEAANRIEHCEIDLLVDLNGYSAVPRLPLVALRPAPVIVGWFNAYATTGMACYDYLIGDEDVIPPDEEKFHCEKILRVRGSYLTFEISYPVPPVASLPWSTKRAITFGCLASQYKINDEVLDAWCGILRQVPNSSLILRNTALTSPGNRRFVQAMFEKRDVSPSMLSLRGGLDHYRFLRTYDEIDVALDTFPYNGGTTTTEAIWQGVPVVTFAGDRWASRTSASILRAGNLGQFIASGIQGYISLAVSLGSGAGPRETLAELRSTMRCRLAASSVCDTESFAQSMERLYHEMTSPAANRAGD